MNKVQSFRSSTGTHLSGLRHRVQPIARRIVFGLAVFLVAGVILGLSGCAYEALTAASDDEQYAPPGQMIDVGGFRMHIYCTGEGDTTVILDAGLGGASLDWGLVQPAIADTARVCSYDRAGMGWSDPSPEPRTPEQIARELHTLLTNAAIAPPYVMVGHSLAGKNVRMFALQYPEVLLPAGIRVLDCSLERRGHAVVELDDAR